MKKGKKEKREEKGERNWVRRKTMVPFYPLKFWIIQDIRNTFSQRFHLLWALFSSRVYSFSRSLRRLPRCCTVAQLANFAQPIQTRRPADPSQPNLLFIHSVFSLFFPPSTIVLRSLWSSLPVFRSTDASIVVAHRLVSPLDNERNQPVYPVICTPYV